jgi:hypothetical protein
LSQRIFIYCFHYELNLSLVMACVVKREPFSAGYTYGVLI